MNMNHSWTSAAKQAGQHNCFTSEMISHANLHQIKAAITKKKEKSSKHNLLSVKELTQSIFQSYNPSRCLKK